MATPVELLLGIAPALPSALIGSRFVQRSVRVARALPPIADAIGFECRLRASTGRVDLGVSIPSPRRWLTMSPRIPAWPASWARIAAFFERWRDPRSRLPKWIPFVFFEFDMDDSGASVPVPSTFLSLDAPLRDGSVSGLQRRLPVRAVPELAAATEALRLLLGRRLTRRIGTALRNCFTALSPSAHVLHVGAMLGRPTSALRVSVGLFTDDLHAYLGAIGWRTWSAALEREVRALAPERVHCELDVGARVGSTLGLVLAHAGSSNGDRTWDAVLEDLAVRGLCSRKKAETLLEWPTATTERLGPSGHPHRVERRISHVKVVCDENGATEAKAYITVRAHPVVF